MDALEGQKENVLVESDSGNYLVNFVVNYMFVFPPAAM
jgi:hypothetical protein